ncbi:MAG: T9SS type A sorting domain-containing protein [Sediminibacterium sp.]
MNVDVSGGNDKINDFALDANENLIICGSAETTLNGTDHNCFTLLINSAGVLQWQHTNGNGGIDLDENIALFSDNTNIYVAQNIDSDAGINENISVQVQKYDNAGVLANTYSYTSSLPTVADDILIDNYGTPLVLAHINTAFPSDIHYSMNILKVNSLECVMLESFSTSDSIDVGNVFTFLPNQLFIGGSTWHYSEQRNAMVVKYNFTDTQGVANLMEESANVYPNPFSTAIQFSSTEDILKINIYNIQGELVETQFPNKKSGVLDLSHLSAGAYIIQGQGKQSLFTKQLIKQ